ncbi:hypothetical protein ACFSQT_28630 [Mesorhizobium calcicola]|uniref:Transposase n=1 Tax=Mesorhizobium calcicola TaxID=1300310 RepID=A0ABW4WLQ3_9HYPH
MVKSNPCNTGATRIARFVPGMFPRNEAWAMHAGRNQTKSPIPILQIADDRQAPAMVELANGENEPLALTALRDLVRPPDGDRTG